jgi:hypothetical protein
MMLERELEVAVELVARLKDPIARLADVDRGLAEFMRRASCRLAVAINEARWHEGEVRAELVRKAMENVSEVYSALQLAEAWNRLDAVSIAAARVLLDREMEMLSQGDAGGRKRLVG